MTIGPLVVPWCEDERALERLIQIESVGDESVVAPLTAGLDIACVHDEVDIVVPVDLETSLANGSSLAAPYGMSPIKASANGATPLPQSGVC